jgi:hypothetical protein
LRSLAALSDDLATAIIELAASGKTVRLKLSRIEALKALARRLGLFGGGLMLVLLGLVAICAAILGASWAIFDTLKFDVAGVTSWRLSFLRHSH